MEGSHFIPGVVDPKDLGADLLCVLDVPDREELKRRANSPNHLRRHLSAWDLERLIMLQDQLLAQARSYCAPVVVNVDLTDAVGQVRQAVEGLD
jgi:2-phosphoglycerate kinase